MPKIAKAGIKIDAMAIDKTSLPNAEWGSPLIFTSGLRGKYQILTWSPARRAWQFVARDRGAITVVDSRWAGRLALQIDTQVPLMPIHS
jgi:hypothetical protein